jgi:hypothetical protein
VLAAVPTIAPVVEMSGHTQETYDRDLAACQQTARAARNNTNVAEDVGMGAAGGGALGAVAGALAGLVGGGGYAEATTECREQRMVEICVRARGHTVLG